MEYNKNTEDSVVAISIKGQFTFADHQAFREILESLDRAEVSRLVINMSEVDFIDSAALGMLLLAREETQKMDIALALKGSQGQVKKMFMVSKFDTLFDIED